MASFIVPGLDLDDVLAAATTAHGRELYAALVRAAGELSAFVRGQGDHATDRAGAETASTTSSAPDPPPDPPTAGPAPAQPSSGEVPLLRPRRGVSPATAERVNHLRRTIADYFAARPGQWIAPRSVIADTAIGANAVRDVLAILLEAEVLEHNGGKRTAARYRKPVPTDEDLEDRRRFEAGKDPAPELRTNGNHDVSRRVRRELEREERDRRARAAAGRELPGGGTVEGRATIALGRRLDRGATLPELANELAITNGDDFRALADVLDRLETNGETRRAGRRNGHIVYVATDPVLA